MFSSSCFGELKLNSETLDSYFIPKSIVYYKISGLMSGESVVKYKGVDNEWHKYVTVGKGGLFEGMTSNSFFKISEKGVLLKDDDGEEVLFPLNAKVGDTWKYEGKVRTFSGVVELETFDETIKDVLKVTYKDGDDEIVVHYVRGVGAYKIQGPSFIKIIDVEKSRKVSKKK